MLSLNKRQNRIIYRNKQIEFKTRLQFEDNIRKSLKIQNLQVHKQIENERTDYQIKNSFIQMPNPPKKKSVSKFIIKMTGYGNKCKDIFSNKNREGTKDLYVQKLR